MTDVQIRDAAGADADALLDMMVDFNAAEAIAFSRAAGAPALARLLGSPDLGIVCLVLEAERVAGYFVLTWGFDLEWSGRDAFLTELYLLPAARGRGLGGAVLAEVERVAVKHGARALHLMVRPENHVAVRLYRSGGYVSPPRVFLSKQIAPA